MSNPKLVRRPPILRKRIIAGTWVGLAQAVAACYGYNITEDEAGYLLWNHTGYPSFFMKNPTQEARHQLAEMFVAA